MQENIWKTHIFVKRTQNTHYNRLKENLKTNEFIIHVDYSENYKDKEQNEIQSAYIGHNSLATFMACFYTRVIDGTLLLSHQKLPTILKLQHSHALILL